MAGQNTDHIQLTDFSGGYVDPREVAPFNIDPTQSPNMTNVDTSKKAIQKMRGFEKVTTSAVPNGISGLWYDDRTDKVYVANNTDISTINGTGFTKISGTTLTGGSDTYFTRLGDYIIVANGVQGMFKYNTDTSTWSVITSGTRPSTWTGSTQPRLVQTWQGRVFATTTTEPDKLYYSKLFDPDDWTAGTAADDGGVIQIGDDGLKIKALVPVFDVLLIFKEQGMYALVGTNTYVSASTRPEFDQTKFDLRLSSMDINAVSGRSWVVYSRREQGTSVYVWGTTGVWRIYRADSNRADVRAENISQGKINQHVVEATAKRDDMCAAYVAQDNQIWFSATKSLTSTETDIVWCYDLVHDAWMRREGYSHRIMARVKDAGREAIFTGGYSGNGYVFRQNTGSNYDGQPMSWWYYTMPLDLGAGRSRCPITHIALGGNTNKPISYSYAYDNKPSAYNNTTLQPVTPDTAFVSAGPPYFTTTPGAAAFTAGEPALRMVRMFTPNRGATRIQHRFNGSLIDSNASVMEIAHTVSNIGMTGVFG